MNAKLTAKETALMTAIADRHFSFFDQGLIANDSGIWTESMTAEIVGSKYNVSDTQRGAATVIASLGRKGLLITQPGEGEDGPWTMLTEEGAAWVEAHNAPAEEVPAAKAAAAKPAKPAKPVKVEAPAAAEAEDEGDDLPKVGAKLKYKDGARYTFVSLSKDGVCYRVKDKDGKASYKRISNFL